MRAMKLMMLCVVALVATAGQTQAGMITSEDHVDFGVASLTRDSAQSLDFLDLTLSTGRNIADVSSQFGAGGDFQGFRYATLTEVVTLINNFGFSPGAQVGLSITGNTGADQLSNLVTMLGATFDTGVQRFALGRTDEVIGGNTFTVDIDDTPAFHSDDVVGANGSLSAASTSSFYGHWLVQESQIVTPEPTSMALFGLGTLGMGVIVRRRKTRMLDIG